MSAARSPSTSSRGSALFARPEAAADGRTGIGAEDPRTGRARRAICALALALAPILMLLGSLFTLETSDDAAQAVIVSAFEDADRWKNVQYTCWTTSV